MPSLSISEVARRAGLRPSAIRYYERLRILKPARRVAGQRRYDMSAVYELAVLRRAQEAGFTLDEVRQLFSGFRTHAPMSSRWRQMAEKKLIAIDEAIERLQAMKELLERLRTRCHCDTVHECGAAILASAESATARVEHG